MRGSVGNMKVGSNPTLKKNQKVKGHISARVAKPKYLRVFWLKGLLIFKPTQMLKSTLLHHEDLDKAHLNFHMVSEPKWPRGP